MMAQGREQFKKVSTGNGYNNDLLATNIDRLEMTVIELQKLQENNHEQTTKLTTAIKELKTKIEELDTKNAPQQRFNTVVGVIAAIFTAASVIQVIDIVVRGIGYK